MPSIARRSRILSQVFTQLTPVVYTASLLRAGELEVQKFEFEKGGTVYEAAVVTPATSAPRPGVLMVPNWMGVTERAIEKASRVARLTGATVYVADVYGKSVRPDGPEQAGQLAGKLKGDPAELRARCASALEHLQSLAPELGIEPSRIAAIGFCFGGAAVLELARGGAPLKAVVSFHGSLGSPTVEKDSENIRASVLVLHGENDPFVPPAETRAWIDAMKKTKVDWQFVSFGGAVHSFTDPYADKPGAAHYDRRTAERAFQYMRDLLNEVL